MTVTLKNDLLAVEISTLGAELQSVRNLRTSHEYLWQGDSRFWGRRSPVLFPIVGALWNGSMLMDGSEYHMAQHGFARDREFSIIDNTPEGEAWFALESDDETMRMYPRRFRLEIGYALNGERLEVMWRVVNRDNLTMWFQIGAHPAFNYPQFDDRDEIHGYLAIDACNPRAQVISKGGCIGDDDTTVNTDTPGMIPVTSSTFENDAIILADNQVHRVSLMDKERCPYVTLLFRAPLVGLWSPRPDAPFVCIEPWWGRCDRVGYSGEFSAREWVNTLEPGNVFEAGYMIIIDNI